LKTFSRIKKVKQQDMVTDGHGSNIDFWLWGRMHVLSIKWHSWIYDRRGWVRWIGILKSIGFFFDGWGY